MSAVRAVWFDIGETLLDRTREYAAWARYLGVPAHSFSAVFGAVVAAGGGVREVLARFRPDLTVADMQAAVDVAPLDDSDLYPGVRAALTRLGTAGLYVGIAGNQPAVIGEQLRALDLTADHVSVSAEWGLAKPADAFFARCVELANCRPDEVLYVGDQLGNDVAAPLAFGLQVARVRTGPWGLLTEDAELESRCLGVLDSAADVAALLLASAF